MDRDDAELELASLLLERRRLARFNLAPSPQVVERIRSLELMLYGVARLNRVLRKYGRITLSPPRSRLNHVGSTVNVHDLLDETGANVGHVEVIPRNDGNHIHVEHVGSGNNETPNVLGAEAMRSAMSSLQEHYPDAEFVSGLRTSGFRNRGKGLGANEIDVNKPQERTVVALPRRKTITPSPSLQGPTSKLSRRDVVKYGQGHVPTVISYEDGAETQVQREVPSHRLGERPVNKTPGVRKPFIPSEDTGSTSDRVNQDLSLFRKHIRPKYNIRHPKGVAPNSPQERELLHDYAVQRGLTIKKGDSPFYEASRHTFYHPTPEDKVQVANDYITEGRGKIKLKRRVRKYAIKTLPFRGGPVVQQPRAGPSEDLPQTIQQGIQNSARRARGNGFVQDVNAGKVLADALDESDEPHAPFYRNLARQSQSGMEHETERGNFRELINNPHRLRIRVGDVNGIDWGFRPAGNKDGSLTGVIVHRLVAATNNPGRSYISHTAVLDAPAVREWARHPMVNEALRTALTNIANHLETHAPQQMRRRGSAKKYGVEPTEEDFHRALDANPDDHTTRLVFADWLQERGDPRAEGYRALGQLRKYPWKSTIGYPPGWTTEQNRDYRTENYALPHDWFSLVDPGEKGPAGAWRHHPNRRASENAAALAFSQLPPERQHEITKIKYVRRGQPVKKSLVNRHDFLGALKRMASSNHSDFVKRAEDVATRMGMHHTKVLPALHDTMTGSVPGVAQAVYGESPPDQVAALAAWVNGLLPNGPGYAVFHMRPQGPDTLYRFRHDGSGMDIRSKLDRAGIKSRIMVPHRRGFDVLVPDIGNKLGQAVNQYATQHGVQVEASPGYFKTAGSATDQGQSRDTFRKDVVRGEQYKRKDLVKKYSAPATEEDFQKALDANPNDHQARMVFADWLDEQGDPRANGYRALGTLRHYPSYWEGTLDRGAYSSPIWSWGTLNNDYTNEGKPYHGMRQFIPHDWMTAIPHNVVNEYGEHDGGMWRYHQTRREADDAAAHAFSTLPPERQQEIVNPPTKMSRPGNHVWFKLIDTTRKLLKKLPVGPDYQKLFWHEGNKTAHWVSADGDDEKHVKKIHRELKKIPGVKKVTGESETRPASDGWVEIPVKRKVKVAEASKRKSRREHVVKYGADVHDVNSMLTQLQQPEHAQHMAGLDDPLGGLRGITADALDEQGRGDEATLLRTPNTHVEVRADGTVKPSFMERQDYGGIYGGKKTKEQFVKPSYSWSDELGNEHSFLYWFAQPYEDGTGDWRAYDGEGLEGEDVDAQHPRYREYQHTEDILQEPYQESHPMSPSELAFMRHHATTPEFKLSRRQLATTL